MLIHQLFVISNVISRIKINKVIVTDEHPLLIKLIAESSVCEASSPALLVNIFAHW